MPLLRRLALCLGLFFFLSHGAVAADSGRVRLLTIGNSFANNATQHLPGLARAGGKELEIFRANLGGHSLEQHVGYLTAYEADARDPVGRPYPDQFSATPQTAGKLSLREILELRDWDYITIQQVSRLSFIPESFEPFAGILVGYLRRHEPEAEILVHQTWAYREDSPLFETGEVTAVTMHARLRANYGALAARHGLRHLPVGDAFHAARKNPRWRFKFPDAAFNYANPVPQTLPDQSGSLNIGWAWRLDPQTQQPVLRLDANHANTAGQYLGAAVFYQTIFQENVEPIAYVPEGLSAADAKLLRTIAAGTVPLAARPGKSGLSKRSVE
jgi:hypothetical protein